MQPATLFHDDFECREEFLRRLACSISNWKALSEADTLQNRNLCLVDDITDPQAPDLPSVEAMFGMPRELLLLIEAIANGLAEAEAEPGAFLSWVQNCFEQMPIGQSQATSWPSFAIWLLSPRLPANYGLHRRVPPDAKRIVAKLTESFHRIKASKPVSVDTWRDSYQESMKIFHHTTRLHHSAALMALAHLSRWDVQKFVATSAWRSSKNVRHDIYQAFGQRLLRLLLSPRPPRITSLVRRIENIPSKNS